MSDEKKQGDENWRDATPDDVFKVLQGETVRARVREEANQNWVSTDVDGYDLHITGWHRDKFIDSEGSHWTQCQVYCEPAPTRSPKDGCRMLEDNEEPIPGDFINWGAGWNELTATMFPLALIPSWFCRPIKEPVESGPPSSIGLTYDPWTDTVSKVVRTDETGKVVESISAPWKPLVGEEVRFVKPGHNRYGCVGIIEDADSILNDSNNKQYKFVSLKRDFERWCVLSELEKYDPETVVPCKFDRPVPKGFRLLGDEPRLASDGYWSLSCKDWLVIGDRVEEANRDKWRAIRLVVDEPEPVKQLVLVCDHEISDQALYVDGILQDFDETIYGTNIAKLAKGSLIRFDSYEVSAPEEWPRVLSDLGKLYGKQLEDPSGEWEPKKDEIEYAMDRCGVPASVFGSNPIEVRPIMQIRLPVPASVLGKLGDMLEKHYPGSTMRQVGGYLVFEEPIES